MAGEQQPKQKEGDMGDLKKPSVEALRGMRESHQNKLEQAEVEKEKHIQKMLEELEGLGSEREQNKQLLDEGRATLSYYSEMEKSGKLDEEDLKNLASVKEVVSGLEGQIKIIDTSTAEIKANPDVAKKLKEKEEAEFKIKEEERVKKEAELTEELRKEFTLLAEDIRVLGEKRFLLDKQEQDADFAEGGARKKVEELAEAENAKLSSRRAVRGRLRPFYNYEKKDGNGGYDSYLAMLTELRSELGTFDLGSKRAIDNILSQKALFDEADKLRHSRLALRESLKSDYEKIKEEASELRKRWSDTFWERTRELDYKERKRLESMLRNLLRSFADVNRPDPDDPTGKRFIGRYESWGKAQADPKNAALYRVMYEVDEHLSD